MKSMHRLKRLYLWLHITKCELKTNISKGAKIIYTITYLEQVSRKMPIIFARRYNSNIRYMRTKIRSFERCIDFICSRLRSYIRQNLTEISREQNSTTNHPLGSYCCSNLALPCLMPQLRLYET